MSTFPTIPPGMGWPFVDADTGEFQSTVVKGRLAQDFVSMVARPVSAYAHGVRGDGNDYSSQLAAAFTAANVAGGNTSVELPPGLIGVGSSFSLAGYSSGLKGAGAAYGDSSPGGTVLRSAGQDGPILDFTGWVMPQNFRGKVEFSDFTVQGDGVATPANSGIYLPGGGLGGYGGISMNRVVIMTTGGPCLDIGQFYLSEFNDMVLVAPASCETNDVPYLRMRASNGHLFSHLGFMAPTTSESCGASGVIDIADDGTYASAANRFLAPWFENQHIPTGGKLISIKGIKNMLDGPQFFDVYKKSGATSTRYISLESAGVTDYGGNTVRGFIPGRVGGATDVDYGVWVEQSRNRIEGVKGYNGYNVRLASGVGFTYAHLGGGESGASTGAFEDNSGEATNVLLDDFNRTGRRGTYAFDERTSGQGGAGPRFSDPGTPANGAVWMGTSGARIQAVGTNEYLTADAIFLRNIALASTRVYMGGTNDPQLVAGNGTPEGVITAPRGSIFLRKDGGTGTSLYVKETGTGNTGWVGK